MAGSINLRLIEGVGVFVLYITCFSLARSINVATEKGKWYTTQTKLCPQSDRILINLAKEKQVIYSTNTPTPSIKRRLIDPAMKRK